MGSDQKIRVCHLASGDLWAGAEVQILNLLKHMRQESSLKVTAILLNDGELASRLRESDVEVQVVEESKHGFFEILNIIDRQLRGTGVDILHSHRYKENSLVALLKRRKVVPRAVQTVHGESEPFKGLSRLRAMFSNSLNRYFTRNYFDRVVTVSEDIKGRVAKSVPSDKVVAIHNSIDPCSLTPLRSADEIRAELGIKAGRPVIFTAGRLVPVKGYDLLLEAARQVCDRCPEALFVLAGDGPMKDQLESMAVSLRLTDNFIFTGFRNDIIDLINMSDMVVMSSHREGIPTILLEAMGMSKPVVVTAVGGIVEVVRDGVSGRLVKAGLADELSRGCLELLRNEELCQQFGNEAKKRIDSEFTVEIQCRRFSQLYRDVAGL